MEPSVVKEPRFFDMYFDRGINWYRMNFPSKWQKFIFTKLKHKKFITATQQYIWQKNIRGVNFLWQNTHLPLSVSPTILSVATCLILLSTLVLVASELLRRRSERLRGIIINN